MKPSDDRTVAILGNPFSGSGPNHDHVNRLARCLIDHGVRPHLVWSPEERRALLADPNLAQTHRCIVVAGGDGSIRDTINDLAAEGQMGKLPLTTFPVGNENLLAQHLKISLDPVPLVDAIVANDAQWVDLGQANGDWFTLMFSIGFDAQVVRNVNAWRKQGGVTRRASKISYAMPSYEALRDFDAPELLVTVDGESHRCRHAFAFNAPMYGGGLPIAPFADLQDGKLSYVLLTKSMRLGLVQDFFAIMGKLHLKMPSVIHGQAETMTVALADASRAAVPAQADGDPAGATPVTIQAKPKVLEVIAPRWAKLAQAEQAAKDIAELADLSTAGH